MEKTLISGAIAMLSISAHAQNTELSTVLISATGYTKYQVQRSVTPEEFNSSTRIQETAPGLKSPYIGPFTGNQIDQTIDGIRFNNSLFRGGPNQYYSWIPDSFVQVVQVSDGGNLGGTINRKLGVAPSHVGVTYDESLGFVETASYKAGIFGVAINNVSYDNVKTANGTIPHSSYNQKALMAEANWSTGQKTSIITSNSGNIERTDKWNGGMRSTGLQVPAVYTWEEQNYLMLKHDAKFENANFAVAYQNYDEHILDGKKPIHSSIDSYTLNGEYFFANGFSIYSTNTLEQIMYDNGTAVSASNLIRIDHDNWGTYKQGVRWTGDVGAVVASASVGYKEAKAGDTALFNNPEGSLIFGYHDWFISYDRSTNTPSYFSLKQALTSGKGSSVPNPDLKEEYADTYRFGYKSGGFYGDIYNKHFDNAIQSLAVASNVFKPYNGGSMDVQGVTFGYINNSISGTKFGIDTRVEYSYGDNHLPTGVTEPVSKTIPFVGYAKLNYAGMWTEFKVQTDVTRLPSGDLADVRIFGHTGGYKVVNVGYTDTYGKIDFTIAMLNAANDAGRVLGSSVDVPARSAFASAKYRF